MSAGSEQVVRIEITVGTRGIEEVTVTFDPSASIDDANDLALVVSDWLHPAAPPQRRGLPVSGGERVEDTRTLREGDPIRVEVTGFVRKVDGAVWSFDGSDGRAWGSLHTGLADAGVTVYRLPKPLPPEPPVGAEVLDNDGAVWVRAACSGEPDECPPHCPRDWWAMRGGIGRYTWAEVLRDSGPVRLLGDPIEAPR